MGDIYENEATATDYALSIIDITTLGMTNLLRLPKTVATGAKWTGRAATVGTVTTTIKNEKDKTKPKPKTK